MSTVINEGVEMCCKAVTPNLFTAVGFLIEPSTSITKPKDYLEVCLSIMQPPIALTSSSPVIPPSLPSSFFFSIMLRSNSRIHQSIGWQWSSVESYIGNIYYLCVMRSRTVKTKCTASRNYLSIINLIKEWYIIFRGPSISLKGITEEIKSKSFIKFSGNNQFVIVISLNPITK